MEKYFTLFQLTLAGVIAWLSNRLGALFPLLCALCFLMVADYISGISASKKEAITHPNDPDYGWSSAKGAEGILKKVGYAAVIAAAITLDYVIMMLSKHIGLDFHSGTFFGLLTTVWYILNELLSITENAGRMGAPVPKWLANYIAVLKDKIDKEGNGGV